MAENWTEDKVQLGETELRVLKCGQGKPLLYLHGEMGFEGGCGWHEVLAQKRTIMVPLHPGFGMSQAADWITDVRDLAAFYSRFIREQKLSPVDVIGFSFGGFIAVEMAVANCAQLSKLVLVGAVGLRPPRGEIMDMYTISASKYLKQNVVDPESTLEFATIYGGSTEMTPQQKAAQWEAWEDARAATARVTWKPYMFTESMPHLLENVVGLPTLVISGKQDEVVPLSTAQLFHDRMAGSKLVVPDDCGHMPMIEKPREFIAAIESFLR
jgi:pimeloyl-ACP methyl ester carboxylesterase